MHAPISLAELPDWPAALDFAESLAYTRLGESELRRWIAQGDVVFKAKGANGKKVCLRSQLDDLLKKIWSDRIGVPPDPSEDLDFGDD